MKKKKKKVMTEANLNLTTQSHLTKTSLFFLVLQKIEKKKIIT